MAFALTVLLSTSGVQASSGDLNIYGFMSVGVGILDKDTVTIEGFEGEGNFKQDTIFALQVSKQVNDKTTATGQLVSRGTDDFKTEAAWA
ncbi:MAG: topoisomerase IV, partial [Oleispira sp.]|nr:topoisomerase IV [Oleispira sp.]